MGLLTLVEIVAVTLATAIVAEGIQLYVVYRSEGYLRDKGMLEKTVKLIEKKERETGNANKSKQLEALEKEKSEISRKVSMHSMKSSFILILPMMYVFSLLNQWYAGTVVCRLPFEPFSMLTRITHGSLGGGDMTECGHLFIYIIAGLAMRPSVQRVLGTKPPASASLLGDAPKGWQ